MTSTLSPSPPSQVAPDAWGALFGARWRAVLVVGAALVWAIGGAAPAADPDLGMHLRVGEWIVTHGVLPRVEPFAWTRAGAPYFAYSWLAEAAYYFAWRAGGLAALQALNGLVLLAGAAAVALYARVARHAAWTCALLILAHVVVMRLCAPTLRPQGLLAVALPLCWAAAARLARQSTGDPDAASSRRARWPYAALAAAGVLAANTHLFAPACAAALALVLPSRTLRAGRVAWRVWAAAAAALGAGLLCTPYLDVLGEVYRLYLSPTPLLRFPSPITELTPGVVYLTRGVSAAWVIAPALALLPWFARAEAPDGRPPAGDGVVALDVVPGALLWLAGLLFFGLAVRGLYVWWLVCLPLAASVLARVPALTASTLGRTLRWAPLVVLAVTATGAAREAYDVSRAACSADPRYFPHPAAGGALRLADSLDRVAPAGRGRVVTTFNYGNALLWRLPRYSMSLDGRAVFPAEATALDVLLPASQRVDTLRAPLANADLVLLPVGHTGLAQVARTPGWRLLARTQPGANEPGAPGDTAEVWARDAWARRYGVRRYGVR